MQQTFEKTLHGHALQFNRLLYPVRYQISLKDESLFAPFIIVESSDNGCWSVATTDELPEWLPQVEADIYRVIAYNEQVHAY